jgi:glutathionyl-hydroquinone reductase
MPGVAESIDLPDACSSYYKQLFPLNPGGIVPSLVTPSSLELET